MSKICIKVKYDVDNQLYCINDEPDSNGVIEPVSKYAKFNTKKDPVTGEIVEDENGIPIIESITNRINYQSPSCLPQSSNLPDIIDPVLIENFMNELTSDGVDCTCYRNGVCCDFGISR